MLGIFTVHYLLEHIHSPMAIQMHYNLQPNPSQTLGSSWFFLQKCPFFGAKMHLLKLQNDNPTPGRCTMLKNTTGPPQNYPIGDLFHVKQQKFEQLEPYCFSLSPIRLLLPPHSLNPFHFSVHKPILSLTHTATSFSSLPVNFLK